MALTVLRCFVVCVVGAPALGASQGFGDLDVFMAIEALEQGDDAHALALLRTYLAGPRQGTARAEARLLAARALVNLGDGDAALAHLQGLEVELPEVGDVILAYRARALRCGHRWAEALTGWRELLARFADSPFAGEARYGVADAAFALGRLDEAEAGYGLALRSAPRSDHEPFARFNLARIAEAQRRYLEAAAGYGYLASYRPGDPASELARARLADLVARGRAQPPNVWQQLARVDVLLSSRSIEEAEQALAAIAPSVTAATRAAYQYREAKLAYRRRDFDGAAAAFAELAARSRGRDRQDYEQWLARTYSTAGRYSDAIVVYLRIAERLGGRRDGREALFKAAWLAYHGGDHHRALDLFGRFNARFPGDHAADEALWYMAWNAYRLGDLPLSASLLGRLRRLHPDSSLVQRTLYWEGRIAALLADLAGARTAYQQAIDGEPSSYYGVFASQRLRQLEADVTPVVFHDGSSALSALGAGVPLLADSPEPSREELPPSGAASAVVPALTPTWGTAALEWEGTRGRRARQLIRLGFPELAAELVETLPARPGLEPTDVIYARARLLYGLGDFNTAYRLIDAAFGERLRHGPDTVPLRFFRLAYPEAHATLVRAAAREFALSPLLILAVMRQESAFDERARSWASARGLMQIIPPTGARIASALGVGYHDALLKRPEVNVRFGAWYLAQLVVKFEGNPILAIAGYNAGPQAVATWLEANAGRPLDEFVEEIPFRETRHYVKRVIGNLAVYEWLYAGKRLVLPDTVPGSYRDNISF